MNLLLAVSGSIACYKSFDLLRSLLKEGHCVRVVLTKGALNFLKPEMFTYLGAEKVYGPLDDFNLEKTDNMNSKVLHVELAKWLDKLVIYPASANTISNLAFGRCEDLLGGIFLAKKEHKPTIIFPAMNTLMYRHPITKENLDLLSRIDKTNDTFICPPISGELVCKENGEGKVQEVEVAKDLIETTIAKNQLVSKKILITTGATIAPIDPVRYVTNPSSGKTGYQLAKKYLALGFDVTVLAGQNALKELDHFVENPRYNLVRVRTTRDMLKEVEAQLKACDLYVSSAAISDLEFEASPEKLKKAKLANSLSFTQSPDVLKFVLENKSPSTKVVGFAAETLVDFQTLNEKWMRKKVDLLVGTKVHSGSDGSTQEGFNVDQCDYTFFKDGKITNELTMNKSFLPEKILEELQR